MGAEWYLGATFYFERIRGRPHCLSGGHGLVNFTHILIHLAYISGKNLTFPVKIPSFPEKNSISSPKISDDFFFSHRPSFSKFLPTFSNFQPFLALNPLFIPHFDPKNT